ncbi:MAG: hypothetical protein IT304_02905 [Dehalococcoidia bacterium]|nr:hypothetical protein [Dehalococcoidia bacterium]
MLHGRGGALYGPRAFGRGAGWVGAAALALVLALLLTGCEKPDASNTTSPSAAALLGTTTGNVVFDPPERVPEPVAPPAGWEFELGNARWDDLENGTPALFVVLQLAAKPGTGMEIWLSDAAGRPVVRWSGGSTRAYSGVVCFQMKTRIKEEGRDEGLQLAPGTYNLTIAFREVETGVVTAERAQVRSNTPAPAASTPAAGSPVFRDLLSCPRGS